MTKKLKADWRVIVVAMFCATIVELFAMYKGMNGTMLGIYMVLIGAAAGIVIPNPFAKK